MVNWDTFLELARRNADGWAGVCPTSSQFALGAVRRSSPALQPRIDLGDVDEFGLMERKFPFTDAKPIPPPDIPSQVLDGLEADGSARIPLSDVCLGKGDFSSGRSGEDSILRKTCRRGDSSRPTLQMCIPFASGMPNQSDK
jgi:hypothetical protein